MDCNKLTITNMYKANRYWWRICNADDTTCWEHSQHCRWENKKVVLSQGTNAQCWVFVRKACIY